MPTVDFTNKKITEITIEESVYKIKIPIKSSFLENSDDYYFALFERYEKELTLRVQNRVIEHINGYQIIEITFPFLINKDWLDQEDIWDLYLIRVTGEEERKSRIKSNEDDIRFLSFVFEEEERMFYPFTTKQGNLSFRFNEYKLFVKFDEVHLTEDEKLKFSGHFNYPPLYKTDDYQLLELELIVTNNVNEDEIITPLEVTERSDIFDKYKGNSLLKQTGVNGEFDFKAYTSLTNRRVFFKFYVNLRLKEKNKEKEIRSVRVRCVHEENHPITRIIKQENEKLKVRVKPTKKSKFLSLSISPYSFKNELIRNVKKKWVEIRRSKTLKNVYKLFFALLGHLPAKKNLIMFESFLGKQFSDSPRALYEYLIRNEPGYEMYWSVDRRHIQYFEDRNVNYIRRFSIKWLINMARAKYWVSNSRLPLWIPKPNHTIYLQTWHGTPLKRLAADMEEVHMPGTNTVKYKRNFLKEAGKWDYLISPNAYSTEIFRRAFQFDKEVIESGYPRNDFLLNSNNEKTVANIKEVLTLPKNKKVILYAPTWRDNQFYAKGKYKFDVQLDLLRLREELGDDYIVILRMHYLVAENLDLTSFEGFVYDFSTHEDIRELYLISDILITDYSSVFFDYANLKRPMIFFVYDLEEYKGKLRGFYFDFEEKAPGPLVKTTEEVINEVKKYEKEGYNPTELINEFYNRFCYLESGESSRRVVEKVFKR